MPTVQKHVIQLQALGAIPTAQKTKKVSTEIKNLQRAISQLKAGMLGMRGLMIGAAGSLVALGLGLRRTITAYSDYTQAQSRLRTTLAATTQSYRQNARISSVVAERAAINLGYSTTQANDAMTTMIQTGIGVHASMRLIGSSLRLARVAEMDTDNATRFLVDTMNMFRGEMASQNITLREFADQMSGQLAVAANMASTNIEQLQQAFRYAGTEMSALGYRSHEVMSALAGLSVVGLRGTTAGTRLRGAIAALIRPSRQVQQQIDRVTQGTSSWSQIVHDEHGNLRRLPELMAQLMQVMGRLPTQQQRAQLEVAIFGRRALAAGISLSEYNEAARRMLTINAEIQDRGRVTERVMRMEEERMRSFGMQMEQLKQGLTDLAIGFGEILFGAMDDSRQGFGTYVREVARAIRLIGMLEDGHEDVRGEFNALSPEVRRNAREYRELFVNIANLIKALGQIAKSFMWVASNYPRLTALVIGLRIAFGGFIPMFARLSASYGVIQTMGTGIAALDSRTSALGRTFTSVSPILAGFAIHGIGMLTNKMQENILQLNDMTADMDQLRRTTVATHGAAARAIPVFGNLLGQLIELVGAMQAAYQEHRRQALRRRETAEMVVRTTAASRIVARTRRMQGTEQYGGLSAADMQRQAIYLERRERQQRLAQLLYARRGGASSERELRDFFRQMGSQLGGEQLRSTIQQIITAQRSMGRGDVARGRELAGGADFEAVIRDATRQVGGFETALDALNDVIVEATQGIGESAPRRAPDVASVYGTSIPDAEDAYVNRGGLMGVSSGDIVVSRRHLANAVLARQGAMAGPAVSMAGEGMMVGPSPTVPGGGGGGVMNISIPVMLDGREIARAVGRANVTQLERGGGRLPPGQRRSLRETGFSRVV